MVKIRILSVFCCILILPLLTIAQIGENPSKDWIDATLYREMNIVIPENSSPIIQHAAEVFKKYWESCAHRTITISNINQGLVNVWLGAELCTREWIDTEELEELGNEGFIIRTYTPTPKYAEKGVAKQLLICGKTDLGTLHGVYTFFERFLKVSWLSNEYIHKPNLGYKLKAIDYQFIPHFEFRHFLSNIPEFKMSDERKEGLHLSISLSEEELIPIPVYECLSDSKNSQNTDVLKTQISPEEKVICFSSEDTLQKNLVFLRKKIESNPSRKIWTIDAGEADKSCSCKSCQEWVKKTESPSGPFLNLMNNVVEQLEKEFVDKDISLCVLLKGRMRKAPKNIKVHDRILIELSTDTCDIAHAIDDPNSMTNACFLNDLKEWHNLTPNLLICYYAGTNYHCGLFPQPELFNFQKNLQVFDRYQVRGVIVSSYTQNPGPFSEWDALKSYLLGKLLWDPDLVLEEELKKFLDIFYGVSGERLYEILNLQKEFVKTYEPVCSVYQKVPWWNTEYSSRINEIVQQTLNMTYASKEIYARTLRAVMPAYFSAITSPPEIQIQDEKLIENHTSLIDEKIFGDKMDIAESMGKNENYSSYRDIIPEVLCGNTFPKSTFSYRIISLENEAYTLWMLPEYFGAIVRMLDKSLGIEYLDAFHKGLCSYFLWNEYQEISNTGCWKPFSEPCALLESDKEKIVIEKKLEADILLRRTLKLSSDKKIVCEYICENKSSVEKTASFFIVPGFTLRRDIKSFDVWTCSQQKWNRNFQKSLDYEPFSYAPQKIENGIAGIGFDFKDKGNFLCVDIQKLPAECIEIKLDYSYFDAFLAPIMKVTIPIPSNQVYSFTLLCWTQNEPLL